MCVSLSLSFSPCNSLDAVSRPIQLTFGVGLYMLLMASLGVYGAFKKREGVMLLYGFMSALLTLVAVYASFVAFTEANNAGQLVDRLSIDELTVSCGNDTTTRWC